MKTLPADVVEWFGPSHRKEPYRGYEHADTTYMGPRRIVHISGHDAHWRIPVFSPGPFDGHDARDSAGEVVEVVPELVQVTRWRVKG